MRTRYPLSPSPHLDPFPPFDLMSDLLEPEDLYSPNPFRAEVSIYHYLSERIPFVLSKPDACVCEQGAALRDICSCTRDNIVTVVLDQEKSGTLFMDSVFAYA